MPPAPRITDVVPSWAIQGSRVSIVGDGFVVDNPQLPQVTLGGVAARPVFASSTRLDVTVPASVEGRVAVQVEGVEGDEVALEVGRTTATGLHQVDNPAFDGAGDLYVTYSGSRGQQVPVSIFRVTPAGSREPFSSAIVNPTSMAFDAEGRLYVSSRFEGTVYRVDEDGRAEPFATELGIACGLAFAPDGTLFVGDRSGTVFRVGTDGRAATFATLPQSIAAFHLAFGPDGCLYVSVPSLSTVDRVYRIDAAGVAEPLDPPFGRPQGLAFDHLGRLHVVEALAGSAGVYRVVPGQPRELVLAAHALVGIAFDPTGGLVVCSNETAWRLHVDAHPLRTA